MKQLIGSVLERLGRGERVALVTVLETEGSVPRSTGAAMAVFPDGRIAGTVGGGAAEFAAIQLAGTLGDGASLVRTFDSMAGAVSDGARCGGRVTMLFQGLNGNHVALLARAGALAQGREPAWLVRRVTDGRVADMALHTQAEPCSWAAPAEHRAAYVPLSGGGMALWEPLGGAAQLYLFGAGHVAQKLAPEVARVGFDVTVIDAREELLFGAAFDCARERILADPVETAARLSLGEGDYAIVMASNHETDFRILEQLLRQRPTYLGCIGSRRKIAMARERLAASGVTGEMFAARVHAPIGLPIRAETPEEIAVSIAAELILYRAERADGRAG